MRALSILTKTELKLSLRNMDSIIFGVIMPVIVLTIINFVNKDILTNNFGAYISIGICAVGLMSLPLTLSDYREKKILKRLKITPVSPSMLLFVQVIVQGVIAILSALITSTFAISLFGYRSQGQIVLIVISFLLVLISTFSIGLMITSIAPNLKKAGTICSIIYFPTLLFSGTTVPLTVFPPILQRVFSFLPLTQGIKLINGALSGSDIIQLLPKIGILLGITIISTIVSVKTFKWS